MSGFTEVFMICDAYESGMGHGLERDGLVNPYDKLSKTHEAYQIGYELGVQRSGRIAAQQPKSQGMNDEEKTRILRALLVREERWFEEDTSEDRADNLHAIRWAIERFSQQQPGVLRDALGQIAAQDSGEPASTSRADCMARLAKLALQKTGNQQ